MFTEFCISSPCSNQWCSLWSWPWDILETSNMQKNVSTSLGVSYYKNIIPMLNLLHWLLLYFPVQFKVLVFNFAIGDPNTWWKSLRRCPITKLDLPNIRNMNSPMPILPSILFYTLVYQLPRGPKYEVQMPRPFTHLSLSFDTKNFVFISV